MPASKQKASKKQTVRLVKSSNKYSRKQMLIFALIFGLVGTIVILQSFAAKPGGGYTYTPMIVTRNDHQNKLPGVQPDCQDTDDFTYMEAAGALNPGESFTFTPVVPLCGNSEPQNVEAHLNWATGNVELTGVVPTNQGASSIYGEHTGQTVRAENVNNAAHLCFFADGVSLAPSTQRFPYSFTFKNTGATVAYNVSFSGMTSDNIGGYFYPACQRADSDHDGWNDALERMLSFGDSDAYDVNPNHMGSNYLNVTSNTIPNDEFNNYPPDFNDDNVVNQADVDIINAQVGQGDEKCPVDILQTYWYGSGNPFPCGRGQYWRLYDLDGDGLVSNADVTWVKTLIGLPIPAPQDVLTPRAVVKKPVSGSSVSAGSRTEIEVFASDNKFLTKVEIYIDGRLTCTDTQLPSHNITETANPRHLHVCGWNVPKRLGPHTINAKAYDAAGNMSTSSTITVTTTNL